MGKLISAEELRKHAHDVILANGARHRCIDATLLDELPEVDAVPVKLINEFMKEYERKIPEEADGSYDTEDKNFTAVMTLCMLLFVHAVRK